jgi:CDP-glycerol glycerophosphotransferase (TagB/SpsB family)
MRCDRRVLVEPALSTGMPPRVRRAIRWATGLAVRFGSRVVPKKRGRWIVGGNRGLRYADNSMHFHRYCASAGLDVVWLTRSRAIRAEVRRRGHRAYLIASIPGLWHGLRATWHVFDVAPGDTGPTSSCAMRMNLWHGIPLKDTSFLKSNRPPAAPDPADHFAHPTRTHLGDILASFPLLESNVVIAGLPRNRVFSAGYDHGEETRESDRRWVDRLEATRQAGRQVVGYFPTWRGSGKDLFLGATDDGALAGLDAFLESRSMVLATKWHTCSFKEYRHAGVSATAEGIDAALSQCRNILSLPFDVDLNSVLPQCDLLVTDYSSVLFDYALIDRPQIFVPYDLEEYASSVGFFHDYRELVPGPIVDGIPGLLEELDAFRNAPDEYRARDAGKRARMRSSFFEVAESSPRIAAYMASVEAAQAYSHRQAPAK